MDGTQLELPSGLAPESAPEEFVPSSRTYGVIYADPPWNFRSYSSKGKGRSPEAYYDCMSLEAIKRLPVADWAAKDCVLLMWATDPMLDRALEVIAAWGFTYKTVGFYWAKLKKHLPPGGFDESSFFTGLGFWTRANPELCLLATRGSPKRRGNDVRRLIVSRRREHSRKPDEAYSRIEALCDGPYLEMFARSSRPGWQQWGVQTTLLDEGGDGASRRWRSNSFPQAAE